ncbi:MAG: peptide chain release factor-like protein [Pseudomonadota bacterium]
MNDFKVFPGGAYPFLILNDSQLIKQCRIDTYIASGPGGQHRNRTYSAVRMTHIETGLTVIAEESRSQGDNKLKALRRIKRSLAFHIRIDSSCGAATCDERIQYLFQHDTPVQLNSKNPLYPVFCATLLDFIYSAGGKISEAAHKLNISTGKLNKFLCRDKNLFIAANQLRLHFKLKLLKIQGSKKN